MPMKHSHVYATPLGRILLEEDGKGLSRIVLGGTLDGTLDAPSALTNSFATQLLEYLAGKRRVFDVELSLSGSRFQLAVWQAIQTIPYGQLRSCTDIAQAIGQPGSHRQIGRAASCCPCPIAVPIHRLTSLQDPLSVRLRALEA